MAAALDMPCSFCYYANMACKPISAFHAIYHFAFLYRILDFTHNLKKNHKKSYFLTISTLCVKTNTAFNCFMLALFSPKNIPLGTGFAKITKPVPREFSLFVTIQCHRAI